MSSSLLKTPTQNPPQLPLQTGAKGSHDQLCGNAVLPDSPSEPFRHTKAFSSRFRQPAPFSRARDLPILGRAQGGNDGNMTFNDPAIDWTFRPADLQGVKDAFAVFVTGDSMLPKYKNQDLAYVHPSKRIPKDRFVLVEAADHSGFIKQFARWEADTLILRQYNPAQEIRLERNDVLRVMLVVGSLDS